MEVGQFSSEAPVGSEDFQSQLERIDQLGKSSSSQHMSRPIGFTYEQP